jgi:hypothetical protein
VILPLPDEINDVIEAYLNSHRNIDDHGSQRLQEDLLELHRSSVTPEKEDAFVNVLRRLQLAILGKARLEEWWRLVIRPILDGLGNRRDTIEDAKEFLLSILVYEDDEAGDERRVRLSEHFTQELLDAYLARTKIPTSEDSPATSEDDFVSNQLEGILVAYGRKRPKVRIQLNISHVPVLTGRHRTFSQPSTRYLSRSSIAPKHSCS